MAMLTSIFCRQNGNRLCALSLVALALCSTSLMAHAQDNKVNLQGTIVSVRGDILVVRPSLRPKMTRISFGRKTAILASERSTLSALKPGMRIAIFGFNSPNEGFQAFWVEAAEKPIGALAEKSTGIQQKPGERFARAIGNLKSVQPFVFTDDNGKEYSAKVDRARGVFHDVIGDRNTLLIGSRIMMEGVAAPDGVIQATSITMDRNFTKPGTMFGKVIGMKNGALVIQPRYTDDKLRITMEPNCALVRQITLDPDSIHVGDKVTFWGDQHNHSWDMPRSDDLKAIALLVGSNHYPKSDGVESGVYLSGTLSSLDPVTLTLPTGKAIKILVPAQIVIARLEKISLSAIKPGSQVMLVLARRPDGSFMASTVVLDASPFVGYGG